MVECRILTDGPDTGTAPMKRKYLYLAAALIPLVLLAMALLTIDEPRHQIVDTPDGFELRDYAPYIVAETEVTADFAQASDPAFRRLVDYVQGNNVGGRRLPMIAPVMQQRLQHPLDTNTTIDRPAPTQAQAQDQRPARESADDPTAQRWLFRFALPKEYRLPMLPRPLDEQVRLRRLEPGRVAALRYRGNWSEERFREKADELLEHLHVARLVPVGTPVFARYNTAFVPWFLRRNEVLIQVEVP